MLRIRIVTIFPEFFTDAARAFDSRARSGGGERRRTRSSTCVTTRTIAIAPSTTTHMAAGREW